MMKIFTSAQIREIDAYTIAREPVSPHELMERASRALFADIVSLADRNTSIMVFAGTGNNGGDGLAVARMLLDSQFRVNTYIINTAPSGSPEWEENYSRLKKMAGARVSMVGKPGDMPVIPHGTVIIDAIFGSGINRKPEGIAAAAIKQINSAGVSVISIDVPSGLPCEDVSGYDPGLVVRASHTLAIQFPRLSFMFAENHRFTGNWKVVNIGLHPVAIAQTGSPFYFTAASDVAQMLRVRSKFEHKGDFGHALLAAGSYGKMGAAILAARAALRTGAGLITCHIPAKGYHIMQMAVPEAMVETDQSDMLVSEIPDPGRFDAVAIGPGTGCKPNAQRAVHKLLNDYNGPLAIDADAINTLAMNPDWLKLTGPRAVLTPHPGEFARLAGQSSGGFDRLNRQIALSVEYGCIVALKGAHTSVSMPDGSVFFNSTGNPGMATAGSGDVLTGVILGLLSQGYSPENAAVAGVFLHGMAGDIAAANRCMESLIASDITENLHAAYTKVREQLL